ncbi:MAG: GNAT family N-acetyltransferase [Terracidiphilus sp.]
MLETREAAAADAKLITAHRRAMFADARDAEQPVLDAMSQRFEPWVTRMLNRAIYAGWVTCDGERAVASAGLMFLDWAPHPLDPVGEYRAYLLNVWVEPEYRRRGLARALVELCLAEARRRNVRVVALHASDAGRPVYEEMGFKATNEMFYVERSES